MRSKVIVVSIEGLSPSLMGPYGANTAMTPMLNALAAHGIVLDQCFLDSCRLPEMLASLWTGQHAKRLSPDGPKSLWHLAEDAGFAGLLVTDCAVAAAQAETHGCQNAILLEVEAVTEPAEDSSSCCLMKLFAEAAALIEAWEGESKDESVLVWLHSRGMRLAWDAPMELRRRFADPSDPEPPGQVELPAGEVNAQTDPDWVVGWGQVAAAQVAIIDQAMELLHDYLSQSTGAWSWCLLGLGGVPLGEHGWLGWGKMQLHAEQLQVPVLIVPNPPLPVGLRRAELSQLPDIAATVADLCNLNWPTPIWGISQLQCERDDIPLHWPSVQQTVGLLHDGESWLRVPAWSLKFDSQENNQLYVKPDDRWEVSELSNRCPDIVSELRELAGLFFRAAETGSRQELPALNAELCNLLR